MAKKHKKEIKKTSKAESKEPSNKKNVALVTKDELLFWLIYIIAGPIFGIIFYFLIHANFFYTISRFYALAYFYFLPGFFIYKTILYYLKREPGEISYYTISIGASIFIFFASTLSIPHLFKGHTITLPILFFIDSVIILISLIFFFLRYKKVI